MFVGPNVNVKGHDTPDRVSIFMGAAKRLGYGRVSAPMNP